MNVLLSLFLVSSYAADPCGKGKVKADPATGATSVEFKGSDWKISHSPAGTEYSESVFRSGKMRKTLEPGWNLDAKLANGEAVRLSLETPAEPRATTNETGSWTRWDTAFAVEADTVKALAGSPITVVRMDLGTGPDTTELSRSRSKKMQSAFACIETLID